MQWTSSCGIVSQTVVYNIGIPIPGYFQPISPLTRLGRKQSLWATVTQVGDEAEARANWLPAGPAPDNAVLYGNEPWTDFLSPFFSLILLFKQIYTQKRKNEISRKHPISCPLYPSLVVVCAWQTGVGGKDK